MEKANLVKRATVTIASSLCKGLVEADADGEFFALTDKGYQGAKARWEKLPDEDKLLFSCFISDMELEGYRRDDS